MVACRVSPAHDNAIIKKREEAKGRRAALPSLFSLRVIPASGKTFFFFSAFSDMQGPVSSNERDDGRATKTLC